MHDFGCSRIELPAPRVRVHALEERDIGVVIDEQRPRGDVAHAHMVARQHGHHETYSIEQRQAVDEAKHVACKQRSDAGWRSVSRMAPIFHSR